MGFDDTESGVGNTVYQLAAALAGVGLGACVQTERQLARVLCGLHGVMGVATAAVALLCIGMRVHGRFGGAISLMIASMAILGLSLMGMLPFCLQQAVNSAHPASENVVGGLFYLVAMVIAAGLNQMCASVDPLAAIACVCGIVATELVLYGRYDPHARASCAISLGAKMPLLEGPVHMGALDGAAAVSPTAVDPIMAPCVSEP
eukprot:5065507-Prymnesium_polylepis.1